MFTGLSLLLTTTIINYYNVIAIELSEQQALVTDPKAIQQINFTANLDRTENTTMCFIIEEAKETILDFSQGAVWKMNQYNTLNVKLSNLQLKKLKSGIKNDTEVTLKFLSNVVGDSNEESNFPHKLLLTNTWVPKLCKAFTNISSANIKLSKTQLHKIVQSGRSLGKLQGPLLKTALPLIKNVLKPLAKSVLIIIYNNKILIIISMNDENS